MRIALYQARTGIDPARNADALVRAIGEAASGGATMLFTPEMSGLLDRDGSRAAASIVCEHHDIVLTAACRAAATCKLWVQLGSLAVRRDDGKLANRSFVIDDTGAIRVRYDKMHLFDVDLPTGESWRESTRYAAGDAATLVDTPIGTLGLSICYDIRFPALYVALSQAGATHLSIPAAFTVPTGGVHWHVLARARAIENGAYIIAAAQYGRHEDGRETYGHSLVVDPWGKVILDMGEAEDAVGFAELDPASVDRARAAIPAITHRRAIPEAALAR